MKHGLALLDRRSVVRYSDRWRGSPRARAVITYREARRQTPGPCGRADSDGGPRQISGQSRDPWSGRLYWTREDSAVRVSSGVLHVYFEAKVSGRCGRNRETARIIDRYPGGGQTCHTPSKNKSAAS